MSSPKETLPPRWAEDLVPPVPEEPGPEAAVARARRDVIVYLVVLTVLGGSLAFGILR
ncbi:hypothetical protein ACWFR1_12335 [Streptomyces sp. NPDC055103]